MCQSPSTSLQVFQMPPDFQRIVPTTRSHLRRHENITAQQSEEKKMRNRQQMCPSEMDSSEQDTSDDDDRICRYCTKTFLRSYLTIHLRTHTQQKRFECQHCGKGFAWFKKKTYNNTFKLTQEINHTSVNTVARDLIKVITYKDTFELTLETSHTSVNTVECLSVGAIV